MVERPQQRELVPQTIHDVSVPVWHGTMRIAMVRTYYPPKNFVFRTDSSLLSPRQQEVMEKVIAGRSNKEIVTETETGLHTVKNHLRQIENKLVRTSPHLPPPSGRIETIVRLLTLGELILIDDPNQPPCRTERVSHNKNSSFGR